MPVFRYLTINDIVWLEIRKVILQMTTNRVVVYFRHQGMSQSVVLSAALTFHLRDGETWHTNFEMYEGVNVQVDSVLRERIYQQLLTIFSPYFDLVMEGARIC